MIATGFYEQKSFRPGGLAFVLAMHAAAFAGLVLVKTDVIRVDRTIPDMIDIITPPPPPEVEPPPERFPEAARPTQIETVPPIVDTQPRGPEVVDRDIPALPPVAGREQLASADGTPDLPPPPPVRVEAQIDPRADLQPDYPPSEERAQRDGIVRIRVTIGVDGRVKAVERVSATSDAFWRSTERHALAHWRFRPATVDGRPVESRKMMNVYFRIEG